MRKALPSYFNRNFPVRYFIYLLLLLPAFIFRDFTPRNELKYISIVEEALRNHDWFTFYNHGEAYADKPPLYFWLLMGSRLLTNGHHMWLIGLFSLLPAIGILGLMDRWFTQFGIRHNPVVSNLLLLTTALFTGASLVVRMDMLMCFFIVLSLYTFFRVYSNKYTAAEQWLLPVYIFLAVFSKGPMGFLIPVLSILAFLTLKKQLKQIGKYLGWKQWGILLGLCAGWFLLIYAEGGKEYLQNILFRQTVGRGVNSFHHKEPFWFYFPRMLWTFAPWIALYLALAWKGVSRRMFRSDTQVFFAVIVLSNLAMLSLVSSKLDIYLLPVYPFAVYLCCSVIQANRRQKCVKAGVWIAAVLCITALPGLLIGKNYLPYDIKGILSYLGIGILSAAGVMAAFLLYRNQSQKAILSVGIGILQMICLCGFALPPFNPYIGYGEMALRAKDIAAHRPTRYGYYKFTTAPNMDVFLGQPLERIVTISGLDSLDRLPAQTLVVIRYKEMRREAELQEWARNRQPVLSSNGYDWYRLGNPESTEGRSIGGEVQNVIHR